MNAEYTIETLEGGECGSLTFSKRNEGRISYVDIHIAGREEERLKPVRIRITVPALNIHERWTPKLHLIKALNLDWFHSLYQSNAFTGAPVECLLSPDDKNQVCAGLSDTLHTIGLTALPVEETAGYGFEITFFKEETEAPVFYDVTVRLDFRPVPYYEALRDMALWWEGWRQNKPAWTPEIAKEMVYSTWYGYHQMLKQEDLLEECRLAGGLGLKTVIVDDGWQTEDNNRGYAYCGDWEVSTVKFPDIGGFVKELHDMGMRVMFWYSVPFIGERSRRFEEFADMLIDPLADREWHVLDPRYPKVREYIIGTYERALTEWDLDGFKLDFVDEFAVTPFSGKKEDDRRDYKSFTEAADRLMKECMLRLKKRKPDILLEFRQTYNGPRMRSYGNIFRAVDCPMQDLENRMRITDIRLLAKESAVHSDMIMWHGEDSVESAALQMISTLFGAPQISMKIGLLSKEHYQMLQFYCSLWQRYRDIFLNGEFRPLHPAANYSVIKGIKDNRQVCSYFMEELITVDENYQEMVFVNGSASDKLLLWMDKEEEKYKVTAYNPMGVSVSCEEAALKPGLNLFHVPPAGTVVFSR